MEIKTKFDINEKVTIKQIADIAKGAVITSIFITGKNIFDNSSSIVYECNFSINNMMFMKNFREFELEKRVD